VSGNRSDSGGDRGPRVLLPVHQLGPTGIGNVLASTLRAVKTNAIGADVVVCEPSRRLSTPIQRFRFEQLRVPYRARGYDLVHLSDYRAPLLSGTPFLITVHDLFFVSRPDWFPARVSRRKRLLLRTSLRRKPSVVVCVSEYTAREFRSCFPDVEAERIVVVPPSVVLPAVSRWHGEKSEYFLSVAALQPRKNLLMLLSAFMAAIREGCRLRWTVVGRPEYLGHDVEAELRRCPHVDLFERVSAPELDELLAGAAFLATPSLAEGLGLPPLEAMAVGTPVVVSTGSGLDEVVGDAGIRLSPHDRAAWTAVIGELERSPERLRALSVNGREQAARFNDLRTARGYADAYARALG
jgi:glycosyltransferase involved in cell wall biosynthesis